MTSKIGAIILALLPSPIRVRLYRIAGHEVAKSARIGFGTIIQADRIVIGEHTRIAPLCWINVSNMVLGQRVTIERLVRITVHDLVMESRSIISTQAEIAGDATDKRSVIRLGMHSWIFAHCYINVARPITMGKNVGVGGGTYIFTHGYWLNKLDGFPVSFGEVTIDDNVWLPWGCFIMPGVHIGENAIIGARSVVNKDVPANALVAGMPAKIIRDQSFADLTQANRVEILRESMIEFAMATGGEVSESKVDDSARFALDGVEFLAVHQGIDAGDLVSDSLNVVFDTLDNHPANRIATLSLVDYRASSESIIPLLARRWLAHARTFGMRYYPIDEIAAPGDPATQA